MFFLPLILVSWAIDLCCALPAFCLCTLVLGFWLCSQAVGKYLLIQFVTCFEARVMYSFLALGDSLASVSFYWATSCLGGCCVFCSLNSFYLLCDRLQLLFHFCCLSVCCVGGCCVISAVHSIYFTPDFLFFTMGAVLDTIFGVWITIYLFDMNCYCGLLTTNFVLSTTIAFSLNDLSCWISFIFLVLMCLVTNCHISRLFNPLLCLWKATHGWNAINTVSFGFLKLFCSILAYTLLFIFCFCSTSFLHVFENDNASDNLDFFGSELGLNVVSFFSFFWALSYGSLSMLLGFFVTVDLGNHRLLSFLLIFFFVALSSISELKVPFKDLVTFFFN